MRPHFPFGPEIEAPAPAFVGLGIFLPVQDSVGCCVVEVAEAWRFDQHAVDDLGRVAAVEFPGWVAVVGVASFFEDLGVGVAVAVFFGPDGAEGFAVGDLKTSGR